MKQTGLMFCQEMCKQNLLNSKTMTRRVIKPQPDNIRESPFVKSGIEDIHGNEIRCPLGTIGDVFWQKETYNLVSADLGLGVIEHPIYKADNADCISWKSAMFMPKRYARLWAEIVNIKVERVADISAEDCIKEGMRPFFDKVNPEYINGIKTSPYKTAKDNYRDLWNSLNAKPKPVYKKIGGKAMITHYESYPWDEASRDKREIINGKPHVCIINPWVFCYEYKQVEHKAC